MLKYFINIIICLFFLFAGFYNGQEPQIIFEVPGEVYAGKEFIVNVTLKKENIEGFSRFVVDIPAGLSASSLYSANADFSFSSKKARFIWFQIPKTSDINLSFKVKVDPRLKGKFSLSSSFSYIKENEKKVVNNTTNFIEIIPSNDIDQNLIVDINDFESKVIQYIQPYTEDLKDIACIRQQPQYIRENNEYLITILVQKGNNKKFAKIEENIPKGFKAISVDPKLAVFTFKNGKAKFLWMNLPPEDKFDVQYRLIPVQPSISSEIPKIEGTFSYLTDGKTLSIPIYEISKDLALLSSEEIKNISEIQRTKPQIIAYTGSQTTSNQLTDAKKSSSKSSKTISKTSSIISTTADLISKDGVYYRIQIAAGHKPVSKRYFKKYNLQRPVYSEFHEGWIKYTIGSFGSYKEARDYRNYLRTKTELKDAFVVAYNNGVRITVQEALMISNQKWYQ